LTFVAAELYFTLTILALTKCWWNIDEFFSAEVATKALGEIEE
jgi:hypothetical protein